MIEIIKTSFIDHLEDMWKSSVASHEGTDPMSATNTLTSLLLELMNKHFYCCSQSLANLWSIVVKGECGIRQNRYEYNIFLCMHC